MAATGFLPRVLSFFCALSHLERIPHRPTTCSSNLNHLSHLERVLYNWLTSPTQSSTAWPQQPMGKTNTSFPTGSTMANGLTDMASDKTPRIGLMLRQRMPHTGSMVQRTYGVYLQRSDRSYCSEDQIEWRRNASHHSSWPFYSHAPGLTLFTLGTACVPSIWKSHVIPKELRIWKSGFWDFTFRHFGTPVLESLDS